MTQDEINALVARACKAAALTAGPGVVTIVVMASGESGRVGVCAARPAAPGDEPMPTDVAAALLMVAAHQTGAARVVRYPIIDFAGREIPKV